MKRLSRFLLPSLLICLSVMGGRSGYSQSMFRKAVPEEERQLIVAHALFPTAQPDTLRLEVYYQVYNYALAFTRDDQYFKAPYVVTVKVRDNGDEPPVAMSRDEKEAVVTSLARTKSSTDYRAGQANFLLAAGKYEVEFMLEIPGNKVVLRRDWDINLDSYDSRYPKLSDIELVQAAGQLREGQEDSPFAKGDVMVIPSLTRSFSGDEDGKVLYYMEIHRGSDNAEDITVTTAIRKDGRKLMYRDSLTTPLSEPVTKQVREISLTELPPGEYALEISLHGRRYKEVDKREAEFRIPWTPVALLRHDWDTAVDQLKLVADGDMVDPLRDVEGVKERKKALDQFWAELDPDPTTKINELKVAFYHRVDMANRMFTVMNLDGWRTDRGRILITFGEPDQVDDYPFVANRWPYQEWHYYQQGRYRKFVFVDVNEDGDYRLQYPYDGLNQRPDF